MAFQKLLVGVFLLLAQGSGLVAFVGEGLCDEACPEDEDLNCAPLCPSCLCCGLRSALLIGTPISLPVPASVVEAVSPPVAHPSQVRPEEILHVPRSSTV